MEISSDEFQDRLCKAAEKRMNAKYLADSAPDCSFLIRPPGTNPTNFVHGIGAAQMPRKVHVESDSQFLTPSPTKNTLHRASAEVVSTIVSPDFTVSNVLGNSKSSDSVMLIKSGGSGSRKLVNLSAMSPESGLLESKVGTLILGDRKRDDSGAPLIQARVRNGKALETFAMERRSGSKSESPELSRKKSTNSWLFDLTAPDRTTKSYMRNTLLSENRRQIHTERVRQRGEPSNWPWWKQQPLQRDEPIPVPLSADDPTFSPEVPSRFLRSCSLNLR
jgi:hypothetical protein